MRDDLLKCALCESTRVNAAELEKFSSGWAGVVAAGSREDEFVLSVAGRTFATLCLCGPERGRLSFAVEAGRFVELTAQPGIVAAHYTARAFWITLVEPENFGDAQTQAFVRHSYELVRAGLSKRQQVALAANDAPAPKKRAPRTAPKKQRAPRDRKA